VFFMPALFFAGVGISRLLFLLAERAGIAVPAPIAGSKAVLVVAAVALLFWVGMRRVGVPLGNIVEGANRVGQGDYSTKIIERGPPCLRMVARAFNSMTTRLAAQEKLRRDLMADVAHELRTPLSIMRGRLEGLLDGVYPRDDATVAQLVEETKLLGRLVDDLRTLAHAEGGTLRLQREPTDLGVLIGEVARTFDVTAGARHIAINLDGVNELPLADVDPLRIREVLVNLVANALRYTPDGGAVVISARADGPQLRLEVEDNGRGIPADELSRVFDRFTKGVDSQGSGLGLAIARNLVIAHRGTIVARNRPQGGAAFEMTVPIDANPIHDER
jgi:two-component system, OmpR family, sensor histidine kinase BaeS